MLSITEKIYNSFLDVNKFAINEWRKLTQNERITILTLAVFSLYIGITCIYKLHKFYQSQTFSNQERLKVRNVAQNILDQAPPNPVMQPEVTQPIKLVEPLSQETTEPAEPDPIKDGVPSKKELLNHLISALTTLGSPEDLKQAEKLHSLKNNPDEVDITAQNVLSILGVSNEKEVDWKDPKIIKLVNIKEFVIFALMIPNSFVNECFKHAPSHLRENKQFVLQALDLNQNVFEHLNEEFLNDMDIVAAYLHKCCKDNVEDSIAPLKNDKAFLLRVMSKTKLPNSFLMGPTFGTPYMHNRTFVSDFDFSLAILRNNPNILLTPLLHTPLIKNKEWVLQAATILGKNARYLLLHVEDPLKNDLEVILVCLKESPNFIPRDFSINDETLLSQLVDINGVFLKLGSIEKRTFELVLAAVKKDGRALKWASPKLQANKSIALAALKSHPLAFHYISATLKEELKEDPHFKNGVIISANKEQMIEYIREDLHNFECTAENLRTDPDVLVEYIKQDSEAARLIPQYLFKDKEFVTKVGEVIPRVEHAHVFNHLLKHDPEIFMNIIECCHIESYYLPKYIKARNDRLEFDLGAYFDKQTILRVIQLKPIYYIFLYRKFFNDPEVALAAIKKDRNLIHDISPSLYKNKAFALEALKLNKFFFYLMDDGLKNDADLITAFQSAK